MWWPASMLQHMMARSGASASSSSERRPRESNAVIRARLERRLDPLNREKVLKTAQRVAIVIAGTNVIYRLSGVAFARILSPETLARVPTKDLPNLARLATSTVHAGAVGCIAFHLATRRRVWAEDVFEPYPHLLDWQFALSCGYSIHDMAVMARYGAPLSMWIHHGMMMYGTFGMSLYRYAAFFPAVFGITELTLIPTNIVWYMRKLGASKGIAFKIMMAIRALSFLLFRTALGPLAVLHALQVHGVEGFMRRLVVTPTFVAWGSSINVIVISLLNIQWSLAAFRGAATAINGA